MGTSNTTGQRLRLTTFGESHGPGLGAVLDGFPAGLPIDEAALQAALARRRPGQSALTTQRKEADEAEILSGVYQGRSTGAPIALLIRNQDARSQDYEHLRHAFRPGHADLAYHLKYGHRDPRGGGRSSARETAARVAAGALAEQLLAHIAPGLHITAWVQQVGEVAIPEDADSTAFTRQGADAHPTRCPHPATASKMEALIKEVRKEGDTIGGVVAARATGMPQGLGEPVFGKLHARLGQALLSINACKGVDFGEGFQGLHLRGSQYNDLQAWDATRGYHHTSNRHGGALGGISTGEDLVLRAAFKPVATLIQEQPGVDDQGQPVTIQGKGRHDPCVLPRAVPIVEAMVALVLADAVLLHHNPLQP